MTAKLAKLYTPREASDLLGVSVATTWRLIKRGELPSVNGRLKPALALRTLIREDDLEAFIEERTNVA